MQDNLTRAQHYRGLARQFREAAERDHDEAKRKELLDLAEQYERLADKLVGRQADDTKRSG